MHSTASPSLFPLRCLIIPNNSSGSDGTNGLQKSGSPILSDRPTESKLSPKCLWVIHSVHITSICLNGVNFLRWSQSVHTYIHGKGKIGYLTGEIEQPAKTSPQYAIWYAENSMIMTWLVNSMDEDIGSSYMC